MILPEPNPMGFYQSITYVREKNMKLLLPLTILSHLTGKK
jgi:hypothetical protein